MVVFVVDRSLKVLVAEVDAIAPNRSRASDGFVGDTAHQSRPSQHNPEDTGDSSDRNDPDNQVDAADITHDPDSGADMHQVAEIIRKRRDRRVLYVIFNGRMFSSYAENGIPAWTWRPYSGSNRHEHHLHISVNDNYNDTTDPWGIQQEMGMSMTTGQDLVLHHINYRIDAILADRETVTIPARGDFKGSTAPNLLRKRLADMEARIIAKVGSPQVVIDSQILEAIRTIVREEIAKVRLTSE